MPSTNKTPNIGLNQYVGSDVQMMEDVNADNSAIDKFAAEVNASIEGKADITYVDSQLQKKVDVTTPHLISLSTLVNAATDWSVAADATISKDSLGRVVANCVFSKSTSITTADNIGTINDTGYIPKITVRKPVAVYKDGSVLSTNALLLIEPSGGIGLRMPSVITGANALRVTVIF